MPAEIPGFYYDESKKKYFKIPKDAQQKHIISLSKPDVVVKPPSQSDRTQDRQRKLLMPAMQCSLASRRPSSIFNFLKSRECFSVRRHCHGVVAANLQLTTPIISPGPVSGVIFSENTLTTATSNDLHHGLVFSYTTYRSRGSKRLELFQTWGVHLDSNVTCLRRGPLGTCVSVMGSGTSPGEFQLFGDLGEAVANFRLREGSMWCVTPHPTQPLFGIGGTRTVMALTLGEERIVPIRLGRDAYSKSDVLSVEWADRVLLAGSRDGKLRLFDLRELPKTSNAFFQAAKSSVCWMRSLRNNLLLVSAMDGSLGAVDLRYIKPNAFALRYEGHQNSRSMLHCAVNPFESVLFAGGEDGIVRAWDLQTSTQLLSRLVVPSIIVPPGTSYEATERLRQLERKKKMSLLEMSWAEELTTLFVGSHDSILTLSLDTNN